MTAANRRTLILRPGRGEGDGRQDEGIAFHVTYLPCSLSVLISGFFTLPSIFVHQHERECAGVSGSKRG